MRLIFNSEATEEPLRPSQSISSIQEWKTDDGKIIAQGYSAGGQLWLHWPDYATFRFNASEETVLVYPNPQAKQSQITELFNRSVYPLILQSRGTEVLHASAVMTSKGIIAFCADAGTGKSTLASGLSSRGYPMWGDDAVVLSIDESYVHTFILPFSPRLLPDAIDHFQRSKLEPRTFDPALKIEQLYNVFAICLIQRADHLDVRIRRMKPSDAFPYLLSQAYYFQVPDGQHKATMLEHYLDIANQIPIFQVEFPAGFEEFDRVLDEIDNFIVSLIA